MGCHPRWHNSIIQGLRELVKSAAFIKGQTDAGKKYEIISVAAVMLQDNIHPFRFSQPFCILSDRMLYPDFNS